MDVSIGYEWRTSWPTAPMRACCPDGATKSAPCDRAACRDENCTARRKTRYEAHAPAKLGRPVAPPRVRAYDPPKSQYRGVYRREGCACWYATIKVNGKARYLGYFPLTPEGELAAARAYDAAAREAGGRERWLNFKANDH